MRDSHHLSDTGTSSFPELSFMFGSNVRGAKVHCRNAGVWKERRWEENWEESFKVGDIVTSFPL